MEPANLSTIKKEASALTKDQLVALLLRMSKYKKENKEFASYLLFYTGDETRYLLDAKQDIDELFAEVNRHHPYLAKKTVRKILRTINRYCKFSEHKTTHIELHIHFCEIFNTLPAVIRQSNVLHNVYRRQVEKITKLLSAVHEDVQWDYKDAIEALHS